MVNPRPSPAPKTPKWAECPLYNTLIFPAQPTSVLALGVAMAAGVTFVAADIENYHRPLQVLHCCTFVELGFPICVRALGGGLVVAETGLGGIPPLVITRPNSQDSGVSEKQQPRQT